VAAFKVMICDRLDEVSIVLTACAHIAIYT